ncbi:hypothetical protein TNCV_4242201 [Trichonephila clavipes]|nr:hypothetical protein TNCV_4242201 [Trichonephila clavipes]
MIQKNETGTINRGAYRIISPGQYPLQSSFLQHSHTSAFGAAIANNNSGTRFLQVPLGDFPFLIHPLQLRESVKKEAQSSSGFGFVIEPTI